MDKLTIATTVTILLLTTIAYPVSAGIKCWTKGPDVNTLLI